MPITYPSLSTYLPSTYFEMEEEWPGIKQPYPDGGADYRSLADTPIRRWKIAYEGAPQSYADQFIPLRTSTKYNSQEGSLLGMDFTPRGESTLSNVHFDEDGLRITRTREGLFVIEVQVIKRP